MAVVYTTLSILLDTGRKFAPRTYRFASTGPFYVDLEGQPQFIRKSSAQFFVDWTRERMNQIQLKDPAQREEVLRYYRQAETFWSKLVTKATAE